MEKTDLVLGIDTSCYTTSAALMDGTGALLFDERRLLRVKEGRRGLSQSEMVFQHMRALPDLLERIDLTQGRLSAIVASERPRPLKESYMPAFLVGWGMARSLSHFMDVPLIAATHQHNHMFAGLWGLRRRPRRAVFWFMFPEERRTFSLLKGAQTVRSSLRLAGPASIFMPDK